MDLTETPLACDHERAPVGKPTDRKPSEDATGVVIPHCQQHYGADPSRIFPGRKLALALDVVLAKHFVYVIKSRSQPSRYYTGLTSNVAARVAAHNAGHCPHTARGGPSETDVVVEFADEKRAVVFERYLKSGSGVAFAKRHLR